MLDAYREVNSLTEGSALASLDDMPYLYDHPTIQQRGGTTTPDAATATVSFANSLPHTGATAQGTSGFMDMELEGHGTVVKVGVAHTVVMGYGARNYREC